jgi:hypothetical protein
MSNPEIGQGAVKLTRNAECASVLGRLLASRGGGGWNEQTRQGKIPKTKEAEDKTRSS